MVTEPEETTGRPDDPHRRLAAVSGAAGERGAGVTHAIHELARLHVEDLTLQDALQRICDLACGTVTDCLAAGVTLSAGKGWLTAATTDDAAALLDEAQYRDADGPCVQTALSGRLHRLDVDEEHQQWPHLAELTRVQGFCRVLAVPLLRRDRPMGALNLYSARGRPLDAVDETLVSLFAVQASVLLNNVSSHQQAVGLADQLREAMASRAVIEQAKGVLCALLQVPPERAFDVLRERSQRSNVKVRDVAQDVVRNAEGARP